MKQTSITGFPFKMLTILALSFILSRTATFAQEQAQETSPSVAVDAPSSTQNTIQILTPVDGVDFSQYIDKIMREIKKNWFAAMPSAAFGGAKGKTSVLFQIQSDGKVRNISLEASSGTDSLDQAALKGVRDSSPLDPLPPIFKGPYIELRFIFEYNLKTTVAPRGSSFDCHALASNTTQAQPFDRLELLAFLAGQGHSQYAEQAICERGINFTPDSTMLSSLRYYGVAPDFADALNKVKPRAIVQPSPDRVSAYGLLDLALSDKHRGQLGSANEDFARALKLAPDSATLHLAYARNLIAARNYSEAEIQSRRSLELWSEDADAHVVLAWALSLQKRDSEAVPEAREALRIFPGHKAALAELGISLARSGQYKEAIPVLREFIPFASQTPVVHKLLGGSLVHTGSFDDGIQELTLFLRTSPNDAEAHYFLGVALRGEGKPDDALIQFREAARLEPSNPLYSVNLAPADSKETTSAASNPDEPRPDDGFFSGNVYTNTFFGFSYEFPKGWYVLKAEQGKAMVRLGVSILANGDPTAQDFAEATLANAYQLLLVTKETTKDISTYTSLVQIQAMSTRFGPQPKSGGDLLKSTVEFLQRRGNADSIVDPPEQFAVAGRTFWKVRLDFPVKNVVAHAIEAATIEKGYFILFVFASPDASKLAELEGTIQSLRFTDSPR